MSNIYYKIIILAVLLYIATIIIGGILTPNYNLFIDPISYSVARGMLYNKILDLGFVTADALFIYFAIASFLHSKNKLIRFSMIFLSLAALINIIQFIFFPMDPWEGVRTAADLVHDSFTVALGLSVILAILLLSISFSRENKSKYLIWHSFISLLFFSLLASLAALSLKYFGHLTGTFESLYTIVLFQWLVVISIHLKNNDELLPNS